MMCLRRSYFTGGLAAALCMLMLTASSCSFGRQEPVAAPSLDLSISPEPTPTPGAHRSEPDPCEIVPRELVRILVSDVAPERDALSCTWEYDHPSSDTLNPSPGMLSRRLIIETHFYDRIELAQRRYQSVKTQFDEAGGEVTHSTVDGLGDEAFQAFYDVQDFARVAFRDSNLVIVVRYEGGDGTGDPVEYVSIGEEKALKGAVRVATAIEESL